MSGNQQRGPGVSSDAAADIERWFAETYDEPSARVVRSLSRTSGSLHEILGASGRRWVRVGGVMPRRLLDVEDEARTAWALGERRIPLARPQARTDGAFAGTVELAGRPQVAVTYWHVSGLETPHPTPAQAAALGRAVAALHAVPVEEIAVAQSLPMVEPIRTAREGARLAERWLGPEDGAWLRRAVARALDRLEHLGILHAREANTPGRRLTRAVLCHGDLRVGNARFEGDRPTLIDLEAMGRGPRSHDLGCLWRRRVIESDFTTVPGDWRWFRQGYGETLGLEDDEWQAVPLLALLRAVWTMCLPARAAAGWGAAWARDPDYWRAHLRMVRWFAAAAEGTPQI